MSTKELTVKIKTHPKWWLMPTLFIIGMYCKLVRRKIKPSTIDKITMRGFDMEVIG